jgi:hypothetical protein
VRRPINIEADDVGELGREGGIAHTVARLKLVGRQTRRTERSATSNGSPNAVQVSLGKEEFIKKHVYALQEGMRLESTS